MGDIQTGFLLNPIQFLREQNRFSEAIRLYSSQELAQYPIFKVLNSEQLTAVFNVINRSNKNHGLTNGEGVDNTSRPEEIQEFFFDYNNNLDPSLLSPELGENIKNYAIALIDNLPEPRELPRS